MPFELTPPLFIIPEFVNKEHRSFAEQSGLVIGQLAHMATTRNGEELPCYLVRTPEGWAYMQDPTLSDAQDGPYLADRLGRRRVHCRHEYSRDPRARVLTRFAIQQGYSKFGSFLYVRKTVGGEQNIFRQNGGVCAVFQTRQRNFGEPEAPQRQECIDWLTGHYPDWENPLSYWNEE